MKVFWAIVIIIGVAVGVLIAVVMPHGPAPHLSFGIAAGKDVEKAKKQWEPLLQAMAQETGLDVSGYFPPDDAGIVDGMINGRVDVAWCGNKTAIEAVDRAGGEVFAQSDDIQGGRGYFSQLIVHVDSPIKSLDDLLQQGPKLRFANGEPNSTSGNLVPGYYVFAKHKIVAKTFFARTTFGNHEDNVKAVLAHKVDVATNNTWRLDQLKQDSPQDYAQLRIIWTSPMIPSNPVLWRSNLPPELKEKVRAFLLSYGRNGSEQEKALLTGVHLAGFLVSDNRQLVSTRALQLFNERSRVADAIDMDKQQQAAHLQEIDVKLAEFEKNSAVVE